MNNPVLSWFGIVRLGLVQTGLGAIVVLTTSTLNRVMVVELAMPAILPGALVAIHYALQVFRPAWGHGSDLGARRTPWIVGGMAVLAIGGLMASVATAWMTTHPLFGIALAVAAFGLIGVGVGAAGTSLLVLLAKRTDDNRRAAAATIVWVMMIAGFIVTTGVAGHLLDPFSPARLIVVSGSVSVAAMVLTLVGVWGVEGKSVAAVPLRLKEPQRQSSFREAFIEVWTEPKSRRFAIFVFVSMLAYSAQDLILEPFAGAVFGFTPGETTKLSGIQHGGTLIGMALVPLIGAIYPRARGNLQIWTVGGCLASAIALAMPGGGRLCRAVMAVARNRLHAWRHQWRLRGGGDRLDDGAGGSGRREARRRAHGPLGRSTSVCVRDRRLPRYARQRYRALSADVTGTVLLRCLCI